MPAREPPLSARIPARSRRSCALNTGRVTAATRVLRRGGVAVANRGRHWSNAQPLALRPDEEASDAHDNIAQAGGRMHVTSGAGGPYNRALMHLSAQQCHRISETISVPWQHTA